MNLTKYKEISGTTVSTAREAFVKAKIARAKMQLESLLGYPLTSTKAQENKYEELGKTTNNFTCTDTIPDDLEAADDVVGAYRLFPYSRTDQYFHVDPFIEINKVKLVFLKPGATPNGITIKTFEDAQVRPQALGDISKYIERCQNCWCACECEDCVLLAVDATWLAEDCLPDELLYIWADMVTYEIDKKKDIQSETIGPHTYRKFDRKIPQESDENIAILKKYAGPNGTLTRTITV